MKASVWQLVVVSWERALLASWAFSAKHCESNLKIYSHIGLKQPSVWCCKVSAHILDVSVQHHDTAAQCTSPHPPSKQLYASHVNHDNQFSRNMSTNVVYSRLRTGIIHRHIAHKRARALEHTHTLRLHSDVYVKKPVLPVGEWGAHLLLVTAHDQCHTRTRIMSLCNVPHAAELTHGQICMTKAGS